MPKRTDIATILIIGAGPIVIGQAAAFIPIPAQAGTHFSALRFSTGSHRRVRSSGALNLARPWIPAFAGMGVEGVVRAFAGTTPVRFRA